LLYLQDKVGQATIYRTIRLFRAQDIVQQLPDTTIQLSDRFVQHTHEFLCRNCKKAISFNDEQLEKRLTKLTAVRGLHLEKHTLELSGLCNPCTQAPEVQPRQPIGLNLRRPVNQP
jgi:Fur family transcriptional regulator, ferric uptake regulator